MTTHSNILAWRIHGHRSLAGYSPWGHKESDMTEVLSTYCYSVINTYVGRVDLKKKKKKTLLRRGQFAAQVGLKLAFPQVIDQRSHSPV